VGGLVAVASLRLALVAALGAFGVIAAGAQDAAPTASALGQPLPPLTLTDAAGSSHPLRPVSANALVLIFWSFKCPVSLEYDGRIGTAFAKFRTRGVEFLAVASGANESPLEVRRNAENLKLPYAVLMDGEGRLAESLGVTQVPSVFVVDRRGFVRYAGAWDDGLKTGDSRLQPFAERAVEAVLAGENVPTPSSRVFGCTVRRR